MTLKAYLISMTLGTLIAWSGWLFIINAVDPMGSGVIGIFLFYAILFLCIVGTSAVIGFSVRMFLFKKKEIPYKNVKKTFRHGVLFAVILLASLILLRVGLFKWWTFFPVVLMLTFVELFYISYYEGKSI